MTGSWIWAFREGKPAAAFPLVCSLAQDGNRVKSAKHRPPADCSGCGSCPVLSEKRSIGTRSQLQNEAVHGGLGAAPSTSNLGYSRQRKSQVWPQWVPRGIACRFLVPRILPFRAVFLPMRKRGRLHILLLIIRVFQFDGSVNDTFHNGQILFRAKL